MLDDLPSAGREHVDARYRVLKDAVEGRRALRKVAGKVQADMYISTLRSDVEGIGGELDLIVRRPSRSTMRLHHLGDAFASPPEAMRFCSPKPAVAKRTSARSRA
jgi:hypothetical protein